MAYHDAAHVLVGKTFQLKKAKAGMAAHHGKFPFIKPAGLVEDGERDPHLPKIMEKGGESSNATLLLSLLVEESESVRITTDADAVRMRVCVMLLQTT